MGGWLEGEGGISVWPSRPSRPRKGRAGDGRTSEAKRDENGYKIRQILAFSRELKEDHFEWQISGVLLAPLFHIFGFWAGRNIFLFLFALGPAQPTLGPTSRNSGCFFVPPSSFSSFIPLFLFPSFNAGRPLRHLLPAERCGSAARG